MKQYEEKPQSIEAIQVYGANLREAIQMLYPRLSESMVESYVNKNRGKTIFVFEKTILYPGDYIICDMFGSSPVPKSMFEDKYRELK